ncbi:MAG: TetR family transcriptional regulator [Marinobacter sp.]|uniref:TetR family transcriptional regulator n=1 Tax=Marinobacter sp. TaxID=50741 RepID=UPI0034A06C27
MARRTKAEAEITRQSILDAAEQVFMEKGVGRASLEQIAREAGVTRGAVYWHFRNKSDVLDAMLERVRAPLTEMVDTVNAPGQSLDNLQNVCVYALRKLAEDEHHFRVYSILFHRTESDQAIEKHKELADHAIEHLTQIFSLAGIKERLYPDLTPMQAARSLHTQMLGIYFDWLSNPGGWDLKAQAECLVTVIFRGLVLKI